MTACEY